jgi:hypothetical protein
LYLAAGVMAVGVVLFSALKVIEARDRRQAAALKTA